MRLLFVPGIVFDLGIDGDLHVEGTVAVIWDYMAVVVDILTLGIKNTALAVTVDLGTLFANVTDGVGLVWVRVDVEDRVSGLSVVGAGSPGGSRGRMRTGVGSGERTTSNEGTANGENNAHGHGGGENCSHAGADLRVGAVAGVKELTL